jgi:hypothetical protein
VTYAAEPYAQFVEDLLTALTGGVTRERFQFLPEAEPFRLSPPGPIVPSTLLVSGIAGGDYARFVRDRDFVLTADGVLQFKAASDGTPAPDAVWPDEATVFYVNYDHLGPLGPAPRLNDRNPGSVTRLLAESFAREFAVLSKQLEGVYESAFIETATGRDLDQLVTLVGTERRRREFASGSAIFSRSSPAPGDIDIKAGTRLSTNQPPAVTFETAEDRTLRRGDLTVEVPIRATVPGAEGIVAARTITVIHRPILGIESVSNPQGTQLAGEDEADDALRARARRALAGAGRATREALFSALGQIAGLRDKDVRIDEDHLSRPGVVIVSVATPLSTSDAASAVAYLEEARPAGVRLFHNIDAPPPLIAAVPPNVLDEAGIPDAGDPAIDGLYLPVKVRALLLPASPTLATAERTALQTQARAAVKAFVQDAGIGETLIYNKLIASLMAIVGVLDVAVDLYPKPVTGQEGGARRRNLVPGRSLRTRLDDADLEVDVAGEIVAFDVTVKLTLSDLGKAFGELQDNLEDARLEVIALLQDRIASMSPPIDAPSLLAQLPATVNYTVDSLHYTVQYLLAGVRFNEVDPPVPLGELERPWVRTVTLTSDSA